MTYQIPYELCFKLDLFKKVKKKHINIIKDDSILEDVKITTTSDNGYMTNITFNFKIFIT